MLTYFLGDLSPARKAFVDAVAQQFGLRVVALQNEWVKDIPDPAVYATTPDEFIWLVHHCQLMLTDSFHGSVFSILFDKPFRCFGREESGVALATGAAARYRRTRTIFFIKTKFPFRRFWSGSGNLHWII